LTVLPPESVQVLARKGMDQDAKIIVILLILLLLNAFWLNKILCRLPGILLFGRIAARERLKSL